MSEPITEELLKEYTTPDTVPATKRDPRLDRFACPKCGTVTETPKLHWTRGWSDGYGYYPPTMEVFCGRCGYAENVLERLQKQPIYQMSVGQQRIVVATAILTVALIVLAIITQS